MSRRILYITVRADIGGGPKHVYELSKKMIDSGYEIFVASPNDSPFGEKFKKKAKGFLEIPHRKITLLSLFKVVMFCKKNAIEIVHSHGRGAGYYSRVLKLFGVKVIHSFHGVHSEKSVKNRVSLFFERILKIFTDKFVCVSDDEFEKALKFKIAYKNLTLVISNGVVISRRVKEKIPEGTLTLGTLTRLDPMKGNDILIKYFSELHEEGFKLLIAGDGEERENLISLAKSNSKINFLGNISDTVSFLNDIDIFVSCSKGEGLPLAVLEAQSFGVPCLLSNVKGHIELSQEGSAILFDLSSFLEFEKGIEQLQDQKKFLDVRKRGRELIEKSYSFEKMLKSYLDLYSELTH